MSGCVITMPAGVTSNFDGTASKTGKASGTYFMGIPVGFNMDLSVEAAAQQGGITEVHSVNTTVKNYLVVMVVQTTVTGQ
jgi:hypothetical protein